MQFQLMKDPFSGSISTTLIIYTDENGTIWQVPEGHRFWQIYQDWLSQGNTPSPAA